MIDKSKFEKQFSNCSNKNLKLLELYKDLHIPEFIFKNLHNIAGGV